MRACPGAAVFISLLSLCRHLVFKRIVIQNLVLCHSPSHTPIRCKNPNNLQPHLFTEISEHNIRTPASAPPAPLLASDKPAPIRPAIKPRKGKRRQNVFADDCRFPDQSHDFNVLPHNIDGGSVLRKRKHSARALDDIDPAFNVAYDKALHGERFRKEFKPSPWLTDEQNAIVADLIKEFWCVFDDNGLFIPVRDYECEIDTGDAPPIAVKKINYSPYETPIMWKCIAALEKLGHISQVRDGRWMFKALLAPKPHQEHVFSIDWFVWRFCVNYISLNLVTRIIVYPIPRCGSAVLIDFDGCKYDVTMDAPQGYHQIWVKKASREKLSFAGVNATFWSSEWTAYFHHDDA